MRCPALSIRRSAAVARRRVAVARRRAAATMWWELSARMRGLVLGRGGLLDFGDHPVEVGQDLLVHLDHAGLAVALGHVDQGQRGCLLFLEFGQVLKQLVFVQGARDGMTRPLESVLGC